MEVTIRNMAIGTAKRWCDVLRGHYDKHLKKLEQSPRSPTETSTLLVNGDSNSNGYASYNPLIDHITKVAIKLSKKPIDDETDLVIQSMSANQLILPDDMGRTKQRMQYSGPHYFTVQKKTHDPATYKEKQTSKSGR